MKTESPDWHEAALSQTAERFEAGLEQPISWDEAKRELFKRAE